MNITGLGLMLAMGIVAGAAQAGGTPAGWNAVVSGHSRPGEYPTIAAAIDAAPEQGEPWRILVKNGLWQERLVINKPLLLAGESRAGTIIAASTPAGAMDSSGARTLGTGRTSTVEVRAFGVTLERLTIRNTFDYPANQALPEGDPRKLADTQAVALMVAEQADRARFRQVDLESYQDTFYSKAGSRSYFTDCRISGHIDFIFGSGVAVFEHCEIVSRANGYHHPAGYIAAPSTDVNSPYGLIFIHSRLSHEPGVMPGSVALGRPWHPTTRFADGRYADPDAIGMAAYLECEMGEHIFGWDKMSGKDKQGHRRWFYPQESRFYTFNNRGSGASAGEAGYQINARTAARFWPENVLADWPPALRQ